jgi:putative phage-type endonuclease
MQANNDFLINSEMEEPPAADTVITIYDDNVSDVDDDASPPGTFETWIDLLSDPEIEQLEETVLELMEDCIYGQLVDMVDPKFYKNICNDITVHLFGIWNDARICTDTEEDYAEVGRFVDNMYTKYMAEYNIMPPRQCDIEAYYHCSDKERVDIQSSISRINSIPDTKQKTKEWYVSRYGMLTASNIYKALGSESQKNSLIYEKCKPLTMDHSSGNINTENPMHWGVKYEPITAAIYEHIFSTTLSYYGCIPHAQYPFIGASPDGIVADPRHIRYGHMVEIKNIVNRDITGIPKEEYWVQMQVQLETCNLEYCDFIETRIKEYETAEQYYAVNDEHTYKGVVLYFVRKMLVADAAQKYTVEDGKYNDPHYVYMPLEVSIEKTAQWIAAKRHELRDEYVLYKTNYWYLQEISCVIVQRNRDWFQSAVPSFISIWNTIQRERISGYDHRATVKKPKLVVEKRPDSNDPVVSNGCSQSPGSRTFDNRMNGNGGTGGGICLIKLDESGDIMQ